MSKKITDKMRLDWLDSNFRNDNGFDIFWSVTDCYKIAPHNNYMNYETRNSLRGAIDVAIRKRESA